jgi:hypothetical protein
MAIRKAMAEVR